VSNFAAVSGSKYRSEAPGTAIVANINTPSVTRGSDGASFDVCLESSRGAFIALMYSYYTLVPDNLKFILV